MLEYGETELATQESALDVRSLPRDAQDRLTRFFRILIEWEAARKAERTYADHDNETDHSPQQ